VQSNTNLLYPRQPSSPTRILEQNRNTTRTFIPSLKPSNRANVPSTSTVGISFSLRPPSLPAIPSFPTTGANLGLDCIPVHPKNTLFDTLEGFCCCFESCGTFCRKLNSTMTFCAMVFEFKRTATREDGKLSRQFLRCGRRTSSACAAEVLREAIVGGRWRMNTEIHQTRHTIVGHADKMLFSSVKGKEAEARRLTSLQISSPHAQSFPLTLTTQAAYVLSLKTLLDVSTDDASRRCAFRLSSAPRSYAKFPFREHWPAHTGQA
jgi:hypothetical protein